MLLCFFPVKELATLHILIESEVSGDNHGFIIAATSCGIELSIIHIKLTYMHDSKTK